MILVRLRECIRTELLAHARQDAPNECCGMLIGRDRMIEESVRVRNIASSPTTRYLLDPAEHIAINKRLRGTPQSVIGVYHSHPRSPAVPSEADCAEALYPDFVWVIVSLVDPEANVAAFILTGGAFDSVPLVLES